MLVLRFFFLLYAHLCSARFGTLKQSFSLTAHNEISENLRAHNRMEVAMAISIDFGGIQ